MGVRARRAYQEAWCGALVAHAWRRAPGVRRRLEAAGLRPAAVRTLGDLARLPVVKKAAMPDLQRAAPPFGGSPRRGPRTSAGCSCRPGRSTSPSRAGTGAPGARRRRRTPAASGQATWSSTRSSDHLTPAAHLFDRGLALLGCTVVPTGPGTWRCRSGPSSTSGHGLRRHPVVPPGDLEARRREGAGASPAPGRPGRRRGAAARRSGGPSRPTTAS